MTSLTRTKDQTWLTAMCIQCGYGDYLGARRVPVWAGMIGYDHNRFYIHRNADGVSGGGCGLLWASPRCYRVVLFFRQDGVTEEDVAEAYADLVKEARALKATRLFFCDSALAYKAANAAEVMAFYRMKPTIDTVYVAGVPMPAYERVL